jgi:hypothetical protein
MFKFIKNIIETIGQKIKEKKQKQEELRKKLLNIDILKDETTKMFLNGNLVISEANNYIEKRRIELNLGEEDIKGIKVNLYKLVFDKALDDFKLTKDEEEELNKLQKDLNISDEEIYRTKKMLAKYSLLREIQNGNLPNVSVSNLILKKEEKVYWIAKAFLSTEKIVTKKIGGVYSGVSFRIVKGVTYRVGSIKAETIREKTESAIGGELILTNKRVIWRGEGKSVVASWDKIIDIEFSSTGITFTLANKEKPLCVKYIDRDDLDIVGSIISYIVNKGDVF